ncbi:unnamed protein product [Brachionus calyciflorus]|uniref:Uncharacterized protein n=1 Tax=Brachionus calyciflorus TaxID=104777 RepID=A0A813U6Y4_9BILA|nr:unnamed protein product [Brachionus calyciflorus]
MESSDSKHSNTYNYDYPEDFIFQHDLHYQDTLRVRGQNIIQKLDKTTPFFYNTDHSRIPNVNVHRENDRS